MSLYLADRDSSPVAGWGRWIQVSCGAGSSGYRASGNLHVKEKIIYPSSKFFFYALNFIDIAQTTCA